MVDSLGLATQNYSNHAFLVLTLHITQLRLNNISQTYGGSGGGLGVVFVDSGQSKILIKKSFFSGNSHSYGAAYTALADNGTVVSTIDDCTFSNNVASGSGGAIYVASSDSTICTMKIYNSRFLSNTAYYSGGTIYPVRSKLNIENSLFMNNMVSYSSSMGAVFDLISSSVIVNNCIFNQNIATYGGVLHCFAIGNTEQKFSNCNFFNNTATISGGVFSNYDGYVYSSDDLGIWADFSENKVILQNCLVWQNTAPDEPVFKSQVYSNFTPPEVDFLATYSIIQNGYPGTGNLNADPRFVDSANDNFRLQPNSPAINTGSPDITDLLPTDIDGNPRIQGNRVDMGAYEFIGCSICLPFTISRIH